MKILLEIFPEDVGLEREPNVLFRDQDSARAVVLNDRGEAAVLFVGQYGYHKLPGGGIEEGESIEEALRREVREEAGVEIASIKPLGDVIEHRYHSGKKKNSHAFLARQKGAQKPPQFTEKEKTRQFKLRWTPFEEALFQVRSETQITDKTARFIHLRDLAIMEAAALEIESGCL